MKTSFAKPFLAVCLVNFLLLGVVSYLGYLHLVVGPRMMNTYVCVWAAHDLLQEYVTANPGRWPSGWNDLDPYFEKVNRGYGLPDMEYLRARVRIDFRIKPTEFKSSKQSGMAVSLSALELADAVQLSAIKEANERLERLILSQDQRDGLSVDHKD